MSLARGYPNKFVLNIAWYGFSTSLFLTLLPQLILNRSLLPWYISLFLGISLGIGVIPFLQKHFHLDQERLLNVTISHSLLILLLLGLYTLLVPALQFAFAFRLPPAREALIFLLLTTLLLIRPMLDIMQSVVDRFILKTKPDYQSILCDISGRIATSLHLLDLLNVVTTELPGRLNLTSVGLMILEENRSRLYPEYLRFGCRPWSDSRLITLFREGNKHFFCRPVYADPQLSRELLEIHDAGFSLVYGLHGGSQFGGMLLLGLRKDGADHSRRDVQIFGTLANQVSIAVENALNFEFLVESKEQLQLVYDKLVQAEKMAALGELTTVLAHELKNPLAIIRGSAQYLASSERSIEMQQELLFYIMDEVDSLNLVISNLLGLARHKPPCFRPIDLQRDLAKFVYQWQQSSEHNRDVEIVLAIPAPLPVLYADSKQLRQVLLNCVANSEEVMPNGGSIKIAVCEIDNGRIEIVITDTGPGIAEEDLKLVFKNFFTTKEKGVGLGLPVCRQIIRAHNGSIKLQNRAAGGVKVVISLPQRPLVTVGLGIDATTNKTNTYMRKVWSNEY